MGYVFTTDKLIVGISGAVEPDSVGVVSEVLSPQLKIKAGNDSTIKKEKFVHCFKIIGYKSRVSRFQKNHKAGCNSDSRFKE
ncbi:hypothetical protein LWM68_05540 [Niabella sp. W65]|nr:hypothetical protein [Niabella sp. W65]MCH7362272.1 hypothetical protein [Niabella sp. W65]ULT46011.1 hypothetical protein KRR40_24155 [Niabella sp. I65]